MKIPNCLDDKKLKNDCKIRHMKPNDLDKILDIFDIRFKSPLAMNLQGQIIRAKGLVSFRHGLIMLDPNYDNLGDILLHEASHVFYGKFAFNEYEYDWKDWKPNVERWIDPMRENPEYKKILQKHIVKNLPDNIYWEIKDLDRKNDGFSEGDYSWME